jgi:hypothetical protein
MPFSIFSKHDLAARLHGSLRQLGVRLARDVAFMFSLEEQG